MYYFFFFQLVTAKAQFPDSVPIFQPDWQLWLKAMFETIVGAGAFYV